MKSVGLIFLFICFGFLAQSQECRSTAYRDEAIRQSPQLAGKIAAIESFTRNWLDQKRTTINDIHAAGKDETVIQIPVVVHILYNAGNQNISDAQINSQIEVLNRDYRRFNLDTSRTPSQFLPFAADCEIQFVLANVDPGGAATNGIIRKHTGNPGFSIDDRIKSSAQGGDDAWDADSYLNIWVGNLASGILGYSSLPGSDKNKDGVVIHFAAFGTTGTLMAPFNKGRTATHEIGHWLNLFHTWGDADCGDDLVDDTPPQKGPNRGCPGSSNVTCGTGPLGDMFMNYMDFSDDACLNMFTLGQRERMRALFAPGGPRNMILNSVAASANGSLQLTKTMHGIEIGGSSIRIYPNPAFHSVSIEIDDSLNAPMSLGIYNSMGQKIMTVRMIQHNQQVEVDGLLSGVYYVKAENSSQRTMARFMKL